MSNYGYGYDDYPQRMPRAVAKSDMAANMQRQLRQARRRYNMFNQGEVWVNAEGRYVPIKEMSANYAENVCKFLEEHAREDAGLYFLYEASMREGNFLDRSNTWSPEQYRYWVQSTALYRALAKATERPF